MDKPQHQRTLLERRRRLALLVEVVSGALVAGIGAAVGLFGLPAWAVVLLAIGFTVAVMLWTRAAIGPIEERVRCLWGASFVLLAILIGVLVYINRPVASSVYYVPYKEVRCLALLASPLGPNTTLRACRRKANTWRTVMSSSADRSGLSSARGGPETRNYVWPRMLTALFRGLAEPAHSDWPGVVWSLDCARRTSTATRGQARASGARDGGPTGPQSRRAKRVRGCDGQR